MGKGLGLFVLGWLLVLGGSFYAHQIQTSGGVTVQDVRFPGAGGQGMSGLLYTPSSATAVRPAPAVLVSHGFINTREMQSPFAIELSRRGFVVLAMDMTGHGYSGGVLGSDDFGGPDALKYLRSLPFVDQGNVGLEGHSLGGAPVLAAAMSQPDGYRSVVLEGSTPGLLDPKVVGTTSFPRNLAVVFGKYDEFAATMWQVQKGSDVPNSSRLKAMFGAAGPVVPGQLYGSIQAGTARTLYLPAVDHPQEHFSKAGVGAAVDWFQRTLTGEASPRPASDQIWLNKEYGTLAGFLGCVMLILGTFRLLLATPAFAGLNHPPQPASDERGIRWWFVFALTAAIPAATFYAFMKLAPVVFFAPFAAADAVPQALHLFPEQITNQLVVWALMNGLITLVLSFLLKADRAIFNHRWLAAIGIAILSVAVGYLSLVLVEHLFQVDFRFWVLGLKPLDLRHFQLFLIYLPLFTVFFLLALRGFCSSIPVEEEGGRSAVVFGALAMSLGFIALLTAQYVSMRTTGLLITPKEPLNTIIAFQFVPLLAVVGAVAAYTYRRTNDYAPGAFICALFVTWYIVAGTAIFPPVTGLGSPPRTRPAAATPQKPAPSAPSVAVKSAQ